MKRKNRAFHPKGDDLANLQERISRWIRLAIYIVGSLFAYVQISNAPFGDIASAFSSNGIIKFGLFILFVGLGSGAYADTRIQLRMLAVDAKGAQVGWLERFGAGAFITTLIMLFYFHDEPIIFQAFLLVLIFVNSFTFSFIIMRRLDSSIRESEEIFRDRTDYIGYMKLYLGVEYLTGRWQKKRFITLLLFSVFQLAVASWIGTLNFSQNDDWEILNEMTVSQLVEYIPSLLFLLYVLIAEIWMVRFRTKILSDFDALNQFGIHFEHRKMPDIDLPKINYQNLFLRVGTSAAGYR